VNLIKVWVDKCYRGDNFLKQVNIVTLHQEPRIRHLWGGHPCNMYIFIENIKLLLFRNVIYCLYLVCLSIYFQNNFEKCKDIH